MQKPDSSEIEKGYQILIREGLLDELDKLVSPLHQHAGQAFVISNPTVWEHYGQKVVTNLSLAGMKVNRFLMRDGEVHKNAETLFDALDMMADAGLKRTDFVVALGGGVVGDLAGLASALYMRGTGLVQIPTTLLSMVDSSVGGKTAVNLKAGKNLAGVFRNPDMVVADVSTLATLDLRELRAGSYELIKHGVIGSEQLLDQTQKFFSTYSFDDFSEFFTDSTFIFELEELIGAQVKQKSLVVKGDARESVENDSPTSRKILNFGHTIGHALERVTNYEYFKHGEAVGYGILVETLIANYLELIDKDSIKLINNVVQSVGQLPNASTVDLDAVVDAVRLDKKSTGTSLKWVLIERVGKPVIVDGQKVPDDLIRKALTNALL